MSRSAILALLLAVSCIDSRAAKPNQVLIASVGESVMLPCPCSEDTKKLVWQIGEEIVVNHCGWKKHPLHESYVNRTRVFLPDMKGNCSLLLCDVSLNDEKNFTCYSFDGEDKLNDIHKVELNVEDVVVTAVNHNEASSQNVHPTPEPHTGFAVGVPLSLILIILVVSIVALFIRKHWQRRPRRVVIQDPQVKPIMNHTSV